MLYAIIILLLAGCASGPAEPTQAWVEKCVQEQGKTAYACREQYMYPRMVGEQPIAGGMVILGR